jgi:hypothetical protein
VSGGSSRKRNFGRRGCLGHCNYFVRAVGLVHAAEGDMGLLFPNSGLTFSAFCIFSWVANLTKITGAGRHGLSGTISSVPFPLWRHPRFFLQTRRSCHGRHFCLVKLDRCVRAR